MSATNNNDRLNELRNAFKETSDELNDLLSVGSNKKVIEEYEKYIKLKENAIKAQEKVDQMEQAGLSHTKKYIKLKKNAENLIKKEYKSESRIKQLYGDINKAAELYDKYSKLNLDNKRKELELTKELQRRQEEGVTFIDDYNEKLNKRTKALRNGFNEISNGGKRIYQSLTKTLEPWSKANHASMEYARNMGMSQKTADAYLKNTVKWASENNIGILFNKSTDELIQMQNKYSEVLGRNVQLTGEQKNDMLAMEKFLGEDGMMDIANNLENFGMGMSDSAAFVKKTIDEATKSGIAASKLTKTVRENIKMAQNYTFKNGLDGLTSMAKKAIQLKTDMSLVNGFIDKTSTVEGALSTGAQLQVLGGNYAMGSDPLSMMYDSLNNVEGLFDRAIGMAQGKVFYNNKTGNFEMGAMDRYMMKQAATVMGIDPQKMIDVAFRNASLNKIEGQIKTNTNISNDEEMVELVKNLATWDKGQAVVNIDGKDKAVSALTSDDKTKLEAMQRTDSQNLQEMAISLRSMKDIMSGTQKEMDNEQANLTKGVGQTAIDILRNNVEILDKVAKIGAGLNLLIGGVGAIKGLVSIFNGTIKTGKGVGNLFRPGTNVSNDVKNVTRTTNKIKKSNIKAGILRGGRQTVFTNSSGEQFTKNSRGGIKDLKTGKFVKKSAIENATKSTKWAKGSTILKSAGKGLKVGGVGALLSGGISLASDVVSGDFKKDVGKSIGKAAGPAIGSIIGGVFGGPFGAMIGSALGDLATKGIQEWQKKNRAKVRKDISERLALSMPNIAQLFDGENALEGNYKKKQLRRLEEALKDGNLDKSELNPNLIKKLQANNDISKIIKSGINTNIEMSNGGIINNSKTFNNHNITHNNKKYADGGILKGKSHSDGGMPILGSNISVEGGEFVVNKKATLKNLPLLQKINSGNYKMEAKEPLGKQMKVNNSFNETINKTQSSSKLNIEPISINLSGTIKLDAGNKQYDISNDILNSPQLITKLTEMISKQLNILDNGAYNKGRFKQIFT